MKRLSTFFLMIIVGVNMTAAQETPGDGQLQQKIKMAKYILNNPVLEKRLNQSEDQVAKDLMLRAQQNFEKVEQYHIAGQLLEASAIVDYVLRDLTASSQLINLAHRNKKTYQRLLVQLDAFILPEWKNLEEAESEILERSLTQIEALQRQAINDAELNAFEHAIVLLEKAYEIKSALIVELPHESIIVYDLTFDSYEDEYQYLRERNFHYLGLINFALSTREVNSQTRNLIDGYINQSKSSLSEAEDLSSLGQFTSAIPIMEKSVQRLNSVLKILGVKI